jgi:serine/threonine protein kinase
VTWKDGEMDEKKELHMSLKHPIAKSVIDPKRSVLLRKPEYLSMPFLCDTAISLPPAYNTNKVNIQDELADGSDEEKAQYNRVVVLVHPTTPEGSINHGARSQANINIVVKQTNSAAMTPVFKEPKKIDLGNDYVCTEKFVLPIDVATYNSIDPSTQVTGKRRFSYNEELVLAEDEEASGERMAIVKRYCSHCSLKFADADKPICVTTLLLPHLKEQCTCVTHPETSPCRKWKQYIKCIGSAESVLFHPKCTEEILSFDNLSLLDILTQHKAQFVEMFFGSADPANETEEYPKWRSSWEQIVKKTTDNITAAQKKKIMQFFDSFKKQHVMTKLEMWEKLKNRLQGRRASSLRYSMANLQEPEEEKIWGSTGPRRVRDGFAALKWDALGDGACCFYTLGAIVGCTSWLNATDDEVKEKSLSARVEIGNGVDDVYAVHHVPLTSWPEISLCMAMDLTLAEQDKLYSILAFIGFSDYIFNDSQAGLNGDDDESFMDKALHHGLLAALQQRMLKICECAYTNTLSEALGSSFSTYVEWAQFVMATQNKVRVVLTHGEGATTEERELLKSSHGQYLVIDPYVNKIFGDAFKQFLREQGVTLNELLIEPRYATLIKDWTQSKVMSDLYTQKWLPYSNSDNFYTPDSGSDMRMDTSESTSSSSVGNETDHDQPATVNKTVQYECFVAVINNKVDSTKMNEKTQQLEENKQWRFVFESGRAVDFCSVASHNIHYDPILFTVLPGCTVYDYEKNKDEPMQFTSRIGTDRKFISMIKLDNIVGSTKEEKIQSHNIILKVAQYAVIYWQQDFYWKNKPSSASLALANSVLHNYNTDDLLVAARVNAEKAADRARTVSRQQQETAAAAVSTSTSTDMARTAVAAADVNVVGSPSSISSSNRESTSSIMNKEIEALKAQLAALQASNKSYSKWSKEFVIHAGYHGDVTCVRDKEEEKFFAVKTFVDKKGHEVKHRLFKSCNPEMFNLQAMEKQWQGINQLAKQMSRTKSSDTSTSSSTTKNDLWSINFSEEILNIAKKIAPSVELLADEQKAVSFLNSFVRKFHTDTKIAWIKQTHMVMDYMDCDLLTLMTLLKHEQVEELMKRIQEQKDEGKDINDLTVLHSSVPLLKVLNQICTSMSLSLHYFHAAFPTMVHNDVKPQNFLCSFTANKFKAAWDATSSKNQNELIAILGDEASVVLADFGISLPKASLLSLPNETLVKMANKPYTQSVGSSNGTHWFRSPESAGITKSGKIVFQGNDIYSLAISIMSLCLGSETIQDHMKMQINQSQEEKLTLNDLIKSSQWVNQTFVANKNIELLEKHKELFLSIFGHNRMLGLKKMLWFYPQDTYPDEKKLAETHATRRAGLLLFLGQQDAEDGLTQEQNMSPASLSQSTSYNLTQLQPPPPALGSRGKHLRGEHLVAMAQENAKENLGIGQQSDISTDTAEEESPEF